MIFRTEPDHIREVVRRSKHALAARPKKLFAGDLILISKKVSSNERTIAPILFVMEFLSIDPDDDNETDEIWHRHWKYIVTGKDCRRLLKPFDIKSIAVSGHGYGPGGTTVYVQPEDEAIIRQQGLLV